MKSTVILTIGHNVAGVPTFTTSDICEYAAEFLRVDAFTACECFGMWEGERENSTRLEICALADDEAATIRARVPLLAQALGQEAIMCEVRPDRVEFVERLTIAAQRIA